MTQKNAGTIAGRESREDRLQALLDGLVARPHVKHAIVGVESGDGAWRWVGAAGEADPQGTPVRSDTPFFLASITKLYLAAAVLKLSERGEVDLDGSIAAYLPREIVGGIHRLGGVDYSEALTVRHLLGHTSGLPDFWEDIPRRGRSLAERAMEGGDRAITLPEVAQMARSQLRPHFPPQSTDARRPRLRYSDTNYQLLIGIIEAVAGGTLPAAFEEMFYRPLGLRQTYHPGQTPAEPLSPPATLWVRDQPLDLPLLLASAQDLYATAADALAFLRALVRGVVFDDPATLDLMQQPWHRFGFPLDRAGWRLPGWPIQYGLGMMRFAITGLGRLIYPVPPVVGHSGSSGSWLFHCPEWDLLLCGTVDQFMAGPLPFRLMPRLLQALRPDRG